MLHYLRTLEARGAWCLTTEPIGPDWLPYLIGQTTVDLSTTLVELHSGTARVTDYDLRIIAAYFRPRVLLVGDTNITDAGLCHIAKMSSLTELDIAQNNVTDDGLTHLTTLQNLRELFATTTHVTPEGARELKSALPNCTIYVTDGIRVVWY